MSFANEPTLELRRSDAREALLAALAELDGRLPLRVPMLIGDEVRQGAEQFESTVARGRHCRAGRRAGRRRGDRRRRGRLSRLGRAAGGRVAEGGRGRPAPAAARARGLAVRECAKPWPDADADVCEAIDFLEYYAGSAVELERGPELLQVRGERNSMHHAPRAWPP